MKIERVEYAGGRVVVYRGDVRAVLASLGEGSVQCCVTSPPYWGLRAYGTEPQVWGGRLDCEHEWGAERHIKSSAQQDNGPGGGVWNAQSRGIEPSSKRTEFVASAAAWPRWCIRRSVARPGRRTGALCQKCGAWRGELGAEPTPALFVEHLVEVFRGVKRVLRDDGLLWLNMGDSYVSGQGGRQSAAGALPCAIRHDRPNPRKRDDVDVTGWGERAMSCRMYPGRETGLKPKDLCEMPSRVVRALQEPYYTGRIKCEADRIWLAAIVDGEGSIFMHRQPAGTPTGRAGSTRTQDSFCAGIDVSNCSESLVRRVQGLFGNDSFRRIPEGGNRREHYTTRVTGNKAKKILTEIYPYLVAKQHEARLAIGCPASGTAASDYWTALKALHKTGVSTVDCNEPDVGALWEKGWWLRSRIPWVKRNPMPESTTDRPSSAVEYVFLLAKSARPFYDGEAVHIPGTPQTRKATPTERLQERTRAGSALCVGSSEHSGFDRDITTAGRARRNSDWFFESWQGLYTDDDGEPLALVVNPAAYKGSHFATFPPKLVEPMIKAGTSEKGCCPTCGAPWGRVVDRQRRATRPGTDTKTTGDSLVDGNRDPARHVTATRTLGWRPTCSCPEAEPVPCTIIDIFAGSGTSLGVAAQLGRHAIGIELNSTYLPMIRERVEGAIEARRIEKGGTPLTGDPAKDITIEGRRTFF